MTIPDSTQFMRLALKEAQKALDLDEVPIGAVLVKDNRIIARGHNLTRTRKDPTAHAEIITIQRAAKKIKNERFLNTTLYVTLEPCAMCAGAIIQARIPHVVYGTPDPKAGACGSALNVIPHPQLNHRPKLTSKIFETESSELLKDFFKSKRKNPEPKS